MDLQKVKAELEHLKYLMQQPDEFMFTAKYLREHFSEAIAELEKPTRESETEQSVDDAMKIAIKIVNNDREIEDDALSIQQYAEAYHAKKCAECTRGKKQYYPLGLEPLPGYEPD